MISPPTPEEERAARALCRKAERAPGGNGIDEDRPYWWGFLEAARAEAAARKAAAEKAS